MHFHPSWQGAWLVVASFIAGALNAVAGGGSFLSFPALLAVGVAPIQANATNTVALWPGQAVSIAAYRSDLRHHLRLVLPLCSAALVGGLAGALLLLHTAQSAFMRLVPWLLLFAALLFAASGPVSRRLVRRRSQAPQGPVSLLPLCATVLTVCVYIGYFGAGAGFLLMSALAVFGIQDIHQVNALKVVTTTVANGVAVLTFIAGGEILWRYCLLTMVAAACGGYLSARSARRLDPRFLRVAVVLVGLGMSAYFFWRNG